MNAHCLRIAVTATALSLLALPGCDRADGAPSDTAPSPTGAPAAAAGEHRHAIPPPAPGEPTDHSVYNLESTWRDQHDRERTLASLAGRVQVVAMVYTHCGRTCPQVLLDMKRIEGSVAGEHPGEVGFVLVSIDPERDTPERLARFAEGARLDPARWTLLNGSDADVLELAALLGVKYRREGGTEFSHSNVLTVLDRNGEVAHRQLGLGGEGVSETLEAVRKALRSPP